MKKWKYLQLYTFEDRLLDAMNELGEKGWELFSVTSYHDGYIVLAKQEKL